MNKMIALLCLSLISSSLASWNGPPANIALTPDGRNILDTPEVAHARQAHLSALAQAQSVSGVAAAASGHEDDGSYDPRWDNEEYWQKGAAAPQWNAAPAPQSWNPAPAAPVWNQAPTWNAAPAHGPAPVADTPEVAQAKAAHFAALAAAKSAAGPQQAWSHPAPVHWNQAPTWQAAPAPIQLSSDGKQVLDTPEVAAARAAHLAAHAAAGHAPASSYPAPAHWNGAPTWQAAPAQIRLAHDGSHLLDTPEVEAAKAAHLAAHAQAAHAASPAHQW